MNRIVATGRLQRVGLVLCIALAAGCSSLLPAAAPPPKVYVLGTADRSAALARDAQLPVPPVPPAPPEAPTLVVSAPRAAAGFESTHMVYLRRPRQLEHFAHSEWVDTPARMLAPRIVDVLSRSGVFRAVGPAASGMSGGLRLETEVLRLQQEFMGTPSRVRLALRVYLLDNATNAVVASRDFEETAAAASDDPYGGVIAADRVVQQVMLQMAAFSAEAVGSWHPR